MTQPKQHNDHLPPIWNIRAPRCHEFTGRDSLLADLHQRLNEDQVCVVAPSTPEFPGIGISTLMREYAYSKSDEYQLIWWIDAEHLASLGIEYAQLGKALDIVEQNEKNEFYTVDKVRKRLANHQGWLLIFDNVPDPNLILPLLPEDSKGHVVITSSEPTEHTSISTIIVEPLDTDSLEKLYPDFRISEKYSNSPLNGNLLALNLVYSYHLETGQPIDAVLAAIQSDLDSRENPTPTQAIQTTLRFPLSYLTKKYPASKDFLALCSFLSPNDIPLTIFTDLENILTRRLVDTMETDESFEKLVTPLRQLGLLNREENALSIHPTIQSAIRNSMGETPFMGWSNASVKLLNKAFPFEPQYDTPDATCTRLVPHVLHASYIAEKHSVALEFVSTMLYHTGLYIHAHRLLEEAQMCYLRSINIAERKLGTIHQTIATRVNNLGIVEHELGNLDNAQVCFERAMEICETIYGPTREAVYTDIHDSMLTMPLRNLCKILEEKGDIKRAQRAFEKAMQSFVDIYGWNHSIVAECAHNFGNTWAKLNKFSKAQNCFIKAVRAEENAHDCDNVALAHYLNSLGLILLKTENAELAAEQLGRAFRLDQKSFGDQHITVARDLINLGHAYKQLERMQDAENVYRDALTTLESQEEDHHEDLASLLLSLGLIQLAKNEYPQARTMLDQSLQLYTELYGDSSPELISVQVNLGKTLDGLEASTQARTLYEKSLTILTEQSPENFTDHATILYRLGRSHEKDKEHEQAIQYYEKAMNMDTKHNGQDHPNTGRDAYGLGSLLIQKGDTIVAMGHLTLALDIYEKSYGKSHSKTRSIRKKLDQITH